MHARSTTITGDPSSVDDTIAYVRDEVMPMLTSMDGCVGLSLVVDREIGRVIATSSWRDEEAMHTGDRQLGPMRAEGGKILGGSPHVEEWEVAMMHRDHATGADSCCRVTWGRPADLDRFIAGWREQMLPRIEAMPEFAGASMLVQRGSRRACVTVAFDTRVGLLSTRDDAARLREHAVVHLDAEILDIAEMELAIAHLRVPELV
ncbi:hypothetical protein I601_2961 [Nocardioides dokdonensis FR1436]|uniref:ABM domain-containing protein n=1 Tax=Nocardioides dokdonensis FR1436 TaxID=1300347 RepID=A0A1A9GNY5_9ACTN|nr:antibiotic biosynthesis monooxygenase [Nocardioides dokdonensis]ANH39372.1 hypothetical protein I601_2961 [Nocardioides dokdonensis FR1436]